jgi:hypothetical protein
MRTANAVIPKISEMGPWHLWVHPESIGSTYAELAAIAQQAVPIERVLQLNAACSQAFEFLRDVDASDGWRN